MSIRIARYSPELASEWKQVLEGSKNAIFPFERPYLEYHGDRFVDMSLLAFVDDRPVALMPAAFDAANAKAASHPGLTFGGIILERGLRGDGGIRVINAMLDSLRDWGAQSCLVKLLPQAFASYPAAEVEYALWRRGFSLVRRDLSSILPLDHPLPFNASKSQGVKKAAKAGITVGSGSISAFHDLLTEVLTAQHAVAPVHSKAELELLIGRFPGNIVIRCATLADQVVAGTLVFKYGHVWHTQYLASSAQGRSLGALDLVIAELMSEASAAGATQISLGTSTVDQGMTLNEGLLWQKESYGARSLVHDFMEGKL